MKALYTQALTSLVDDMEQGKAPFLSILNGGQLVPVVFGFDALKGLKSHTIEYPDSGRDQRFSYRDESLPLAGSAEGGKLKEVEVRSVEDLKTLMLGCHLQQTGLPDDAMVRVKSGTSRAIYMAPEQVKAYSDWVQQVASELAGGKNLGDLSINELQALNKNLRARAFT